jgi:branched-chain amino acid transport system substrate-binding protein
VICICSAGTEASDTIKQAHEFGLTGKGLILAVPFLGDSTIRAVWAGCRAGHLFVHAVLLGPGCRYARIVGSAGGEGHQPTAQQGMRGCLFRSAALPQMRRRAGDRRQAGRSCRSLTHESTPIEDTLFGPSSIRADGQVMRDMLLLQVKHPSINEVMGHLLHSIVSTLPADGLYAPFGTGRCKLIHA